MSTDNETFHTGYAPVSLVRELQAELAALRADLAAKEAAVENALICFSAMPEASPHDKKHGIWSMWTDGCNYLKSALASRADKGGAT